MLWGEEVITHALANEREPVRRAVTEAIAAIVESPRDPKDIMIFEARGRAAHPNVTLWFAILPHNFRLTFSVSDSAPPAGGFGVVKVRALLRELMGNQPVPPEDFT